MVNKNDKNILVTADNHFGHSRIIEYCDRPFKDVHEMNVKMTDYWNQLVMLDDTVIHLGDFSFWTPRYIDKLNGKIILIQGNHDKNKHNKYFHSVVKNMEMKIGEFNCYLTHIPIVRGWKYKKHQEPDFSLLDKFDFIICGHVHEKWKVYEQNVNVGVDVWDMKPISIDELARFLRSLKGD